MVVAPRELEVTTKARSQDDTVLVDSPCHEALGPVLAELVRIRAAEEQLFPLTLNGYEKILRDAGSAMGLTTEFVPHSLRHCGPANDLYFERRSMAAVAKRGRWANIKSVQRYEKHARLAEVTNSLSAASVAYMKAAEAHLEAVLLHRWPPLGLPPRA